MFGSATFLTPQYWVKSTKQAYPGTAPPAGILGFVRYFITAVYLYLCFGHYSAAALASAHFFLLKTLSSFAWNF